MNAVGGGAAASRAEELPDYERPVPGTVQLMTVEPQLIDEDRSVVRERLAKAVNQRPWLVPTVLLAAGALFLLLRRRR